MEAGDAVPSLVVGSATLVQCTVQATAHTRCWPEGEEVDAQIAASEKFLRSISKNSVDSSVDSSSGSEGTSDDGEAEADVHDEEDEGMAFAEIG